MSIAAKPPSGKMCFAYCGPEVYRPVNKIQLTLSVSVLYYNNMRSKND